MRIRILTAEDVHQALPMRRAIKVMRSAFGQLSAGETVTPLRTRLQSDKGLVLLMPAFLKQSRDLAFKVVSIWRDNPGRGLPAIIAMVMVLNPDTGQPIALMNGEALTTIRTGAGGGLAADLLARPNAQVAAVFGAGVQARAQLRAALAVRDIKVVRIVSWSRASAQKFANEVREWSDALTVVTPADRREAVVGADIIITATTSELPVFDGDDLSPGVHITGVGSYAPHMQEVDEATVKKAKIVVDSLESCLAEAGDLIIPLDKKIIRKADIHGELGQIVNGVLSGRESDEEITFFKSVGVAAQDAVAAAEVLRVAEAQGLGAMAAL